MDEKHDHDNKEPTNDAIMKKIPNPVLENETMIYINQYIELAWIEDRPTIIVNGETFRQCSFLVVTVPMQGMNNINSIDELASIEGANVMENIDTRDSMERFGLTRNEIMQAHASNLVAWVENDYNTRILHSELSFPLLKEIARLGDEKAKRVLHAEIEDRINSGFVPTIITILETCGDMVPVTMHEQLAGNLDAGVRWRVADNPNTPVHVLEHLAKDASYYVRWQVANNPSAPASVLERLAGDKNAVVRRRVAINPNTPVAVLERLVSDVDEDVRMHACKRRVSEIFREVQ